MLTDATKTAIRRHMGVPVLGVQNSEFALGIRYDQKVGLLEFRMNNLQPYEESFVTGFPIGALRISGTPHAGDTLTVTVNGVPVVYTVTSADLTQVPAGMTNLAPLYSISLNASNQINAAQATAFAAGSPPLDLAAAPGYPPVFASIILQSTSTSAFTFSVSATGGLTVAVLNQPVQPPITQTFTNAQNVSTTVYGYVPICDYLEASIAQADGNLSFSTADVVDFRPDEVSARSSLYEYYRQRLADFFGIRLYPMGRSGSGGVVV